MRGRTARARRTRRGTWVKQMCSKKQQATMRRAFERHTRRGYRLRTHKCAICGEWAAKTCRNRTMGLMYVGSIAPRQTP